MNTPIDYNSLDLSKKEEMQFFLASIFISIGLSYAFFDNLYMSILLIVLSLFFKPVYKKSVRDKRKAKLLIQFRDMLYSLSSSISSGRNMAKSINEAINFWKSTYSDDDYIMMELNYMNSRINIGNENDLIVLRDFAKRSGLDDVNDFVNVYESLKSSGGDLAGAIERATTLIGEKISLESELKMMMSQKLFEGRLVGVSPFVIILFIKFSSTDYLDPLINTIKGQVIMGVSLVLMLIALLMIERINKIEI